MFFGYGVSYSKPCNNVTVLNSTTLFKISFISSQHYSLTTIFTVQFFFTLILMFLSSGPNFMVCVAMTSPLRFTVTSYVPWLPMSEYEFLFFPTVLASLVMSVEWTNSSRARPAAFGCKKNVTVRLLH